MPDIISMLPQIIMGISTYIVIGVVVFSLITYWKMPQDSTYGFLGRIIIYGTLAYIVSNALIILTSYLLAPLIPIDGSRPSEGIVRLVQVSAIFVLFIKWGTNLAIIPAIAYFGIKQHMLSSGATLDTAKKMANFIPIATLVMLFFIHWIINILSM